MKKHFDTFVVLSILVVITLTTVAAGFGYAAARSHYNTNKCVCDERIIKTAEAMDISNYSASKIVQGRLRKAGLYKEADQIKICKHCLDFEMSK